jgi:hypothetical protein
MNLRTDYPDPGPHRPGSSGSQEAFGFTQSHGSTTDYQAKLIGNT